MLCPNKLEIYHVLFQVLKDKYLSTNPHTLCSTSYDNSLENSSHTNLHLLTCVHPV